MQSVEMQREFMSLFADRRLLVRVGYSEGVRVDVNWHYLEALVVDPLAGRPNNVAENVWVLVFPSHAAYHGIVIYLVLKALKSAPEASDADLSKRTVAIAQTVFSPLIKESLLDELRSQMTGDIPVLLEKLGRKHVAHAVRYMTRLSIEFGDRVLDEQTYGAS